MPHSPQAGVKIFESNFLAIAQLKAIKLSTLNSINNTIDSNINTKIGYQLTILTVSTMCSTNSTN